MTREEIINTLAAVEHQRWADWQKYLHSKCTQAGHNGLVIPGPLVSQWERQILMPYAQLSEPEKQSDREQVMRYWPVVVDAFAEWLDESLCLCEDDAGLPDYFREVMK